MQLKGWTRTSLIDYPAHIATVLFVGGCNFRCPPCHNADLVLCPDEMDDLPLEEVWAFLERRAGLVDGLVITGGEPTVQTDLILFLRQVRERGLRAKVAVKLDTNGYRPDVLAQALDEGLIDFVAMDVKAPPEKYPLLTGRASSGLDLCRLERSISLLRNSALPYEFRTTVVPGFLEEDDIEEIARWINGAERYVLQQFRPLHTLDPVLETFTPYSVERLQAMARRADHWVARVAVRGSTDV